MNWTAADLDQAKNRQKPLQAPRKAAAATLVPAGEIEALVAKIPAPTVGAYPGPCSWVLAGGRATVSLARPYDPTRHRLVLACAPDEALVAAVLGAIQQHFNQLLSHE